MKRFIALFFCMTMLLGLFTVPAAAGNEQKEGFTYYVLTPEMIENIGGWQFEPGTTSKSYRDSVMMDKGTTAEAATTSVLLPHDGDYSVFVHARDYAEQKPGTRTSVLSVDGMAIGTFGNHRQEGYEWQGFSVKSIEAGEHILSFSDDNKYARFDLVLVTDDPDFKPENTDAALKSYESKLLYDASKITVTKTDLLEGRPESEVAVKLNGKWMAFDVEPVIINDRTLVPFRAIFEALGCAVSWEDETQTAMGVRNGVEIKLPIGDTKALVSGVAKILDQPAILLNDRTLVPLRFVSEALGAQVEWLEESQTVIIRANIPEEAALFTIQSFHDVGTWIVEENGVGAFNEQAMRGVFPDAAGNVAADADASGTKPAAANFTLASGGTYRVWARSKDFETQQGARFFQIGFNDQPMMEHKYGTHGVAGYAWASGGTVELQAGQNTLYLYDTSGYYARCDAVFITKDLDYIPVDSYEEMAKLATPLNVSASKTPQFPNYATVQNEPAESAAIENEYTKVVFYKVPTDNGQVIQNEIYSKYNGEWIKTNNREEPHGYMVLSADQANATASLDIYGIKTQYTIDGNTFGGLTYDPYAAGIGQWYIPTDYTVDGNTATLTFPQSEAGSLVVTWTLDENKEPLVAMNMTFAKDGYYSFVGFEGGEFTEDEVEFVLAPFRVQYKRIPEEVELYNEQYLFTPMGTYSLPANNAYSALPVTKGVVAEPTAIPVRWVKATNCRLGVAVKSQSNLCQSGIFEPVMGTEDSKKAAGESYTMQYRVVSSVGSWFENYERVITNLFGVTDYRENWNNNLNSAIFNTRDLMMDDLYGGWSDKDKSHWNMEGQWATSTANSMQALQEYLLTEDEDILTRRAIPTIANLLTRKGIHFNSVGITVETSSWNKKFEPDAIGSPISGFNANVLGGIYEMSRGGIPFLQNYAIEKGKGGVSNSYGSIAPFSNDLNLYKYTGNESYLKSAIEKADQYLADTVYAEDTEIPDWNSFIYIRYYPNLASLIDIYEVTKDKKYLDAAENVAQWMSTGLWVPGVAGDQKNEPIIVNNWSDITSGGKFNETNIAFWWMGEKQFRIGRTEDLNNTTANNENITGLQREMEGWIPSRVGLGVEQASTFGTSASHIVMESFVGDFMKLAAYTDNDYYATIARNAIVGRFNGYNGYYRRGFTTYEQEIDFARLGPDYNLIYWHHIPPFLAMLEDFLIGQTFAWSDMNIAFPSLRQQGYAYFNSNQYGHEPGKFYDEDGMWLWLDEEIMTADSVQIDWLAARKDGVLGLALMNEDDVATTTTVTLGADVPGGAAYTGTATLYDNKGVIGTTEIVNGQFTVTVPAKALIAVKANISGVKEPIFAQMTYSATDAEIGATVSEHKNGKGYTLQMSPDCYYAYVYITDMLKDTAKLEMTYDVGGSKTTVSTDAYPFEFIIKVDDVNSAFNYTLTVTDKSGNTTDYGTGTLMTAKLSEEKGIVYEKAAAGGTGEGAESLSFDTFLLKYGNQGSNDSGIRFIVNYADLPFTPTAENVVGLPVTGKVIEEGGKVVEFTSRFTGFEPRDAEKCTLIMASSSALSDYKGTTYGTIKYKWEAYVSPVGGGGEVESAADLTFDAFTLKYANQGSNDGGVRFIVNYADLPFVPTATNVNGLIVKGKVVEEGGKEVEFQSTLTGFEPRDAEKCTLIMKSVPEIVSYKGTTVGTVKYKWDAKIYPAE